MSAILTIVIFAIIACCTTAVLIPSVVLMAYRKKLVEADNVKNSKKRPYPVVGGLCVFLSIIVTLLLSTFFLQGQNTLIYPIFCITLIFFTGLFDDLIKLSFQIRFLIQIFLIAMLWYCGFGVDSLADVFSVINLPIALSLIISIVIGVGLINALNLMDGVDGLASGFGILCSLVLAVYFMLHGDVLYAVMAGILLGSLLPFFFCNLFSSKYKMYIGDSGSMILGILAYLVVCRVMREPRIFVWDDYRVSMLMALYAVPVYDTIRVMTSRIRHHRSPFLPDKTHLHHALVKLHYPHVMVTAIEMTLVLIILAIWVLMCLVAQKTGMNVSWHFVITAVIGFFVVCAIYYYVMYLRRHNPDAFAKQIARGRAASQRVQKPFMFIRALLDGRLSSWSRTKKHLDTLEQINDHDKQK